MGFWVVAPTGPSTGGPGTPEAIATVTELAAALPLAQRLTLASEADEVAAQVVDQVAGLDALLG